MSVLGTHYIYLFEETMRTPFLFHVLFYFLGEEGSILFFFVFFSCFFEALDSRQPGHKREKKHGSGPIFAV